MVSGEARASSRRRQKGIDTMRALHTRPSINTSSPAASSLTMGVMNIHRLLFSSFSTRLVDTWRVCAAGLFSLSLYFYSFNSHRLRLRGGQGEITISVFYLVKKERRKKKFLILISTIGGWKKKPKITIWIFKYLDMSRLRWNESSEHVISIKTHLTTS